MGKAFFYVMLLLTCLGYPTLYAESQHSEKKSPPQPSPVKVEITFHLWNLSDVDEKDGTFSAELYINARWHDERLSFTDSSIPLIYTETAARDKLRDMWGPEFDFVNASTLTLRNKTLFIYPDGTVDYSIKILGTFFTKMDLRRFPFDEQNYEIHIQSFLWNSQFVEFKIHKVEGEDLANTTIQSLRPVSLSAEVKDVTFLSTTYSDLGVTIHLVRSSKFFIYQILIPLIVILVITSLIPFVPIKDISERLLLAQGGVLVLVAMKFVINQDLPTIDYLTFVDYIFFIAYFCFLVMVIFSCIGYFFSERNIERSEFINKHSSWVTLLLFLVLYLLFLFIFIK